MHCAFRDGGPDAKAPRNGGAALMCPRLRPLALYGLIFMAAVRAWLTTAVADDRARVLPLAAAIVTAQRAAPQVQPAQRPLRAVAEGRPVKRLEDERNSMVARERACWVAGASLGVHQHNSL